MTREFDIIIFGASGFVGKYAIQNLHESAKLNGLKWAVAGRSQDKVKEGLQYASNLADQDLSNIPIIIADVTDYESLLAMARRATVIVNCVGPYTLYGEPVVKACVAAGAHHVDVTGEFNWLEAMHLKYNDQARESKSLVVGACAFESVPTEMAVNWMKGEFEARGWTLTGIQAYSAIIPGKEGLTLNHGTWDSGITVFAKFFEYRDIHKKLCQQFFPKKLPNYKYKFADGLPLHPSIQKNTQLPIFDIDNVISKRTNVINYNILNERPVYLAKYFTLKSWWLVLAAIVFVLTFGPLFLFDCGRKLLIRYPRFFSFGLFTKEGPTRSQVASTRFEMIIRASGYKRRLTGSVDEEPDDPPDAQLYGVIKGPEPTYPATSQCAVQSAVVLVKERGSIQLEGGVSTPGHVFRHTSLIRRLSDAPANRVAFDLLE